MGEAADFKGLTGIHLLTGAFLLAHATRGAVLAVGLSAEIRVAHIVMSMLLSALPKSEQAKIKAELRKFLAERFKG